MVRWIDIMPIYYNDEPCPKCWGGRIKHMIDIRREGNPHYYEPCPRCGHVKIARVKPKGRAMCCPACMTALVENGLKVYETLSEHVWDVNGTDRQPRMSYMCPKKKCIVHKSGGYYSKDGSFYGGHDVQGLSLFSNTFKVYWCARFSHSEWVNKSVNKQCARGYKGAKTHEELKIIDEQKRADDARYNALKEAWGSDDLMQPKTGNVRFVRLRNDV